jgi:hypothetical protein
MQAKFARPVHVRRVLARSHVDTTRLLRPSDFESTIVRRISGTTLLEELRSCLPIYADWHAERLAFGRWRGTTPPTAVPFLYQHQRSHADELIEVPFERLDELCCAEGMRPTFVFSIGRCGSTLLSKLLLAAHEQSLSEPDVLTHVAQFDDEDSKLRAAGSEALIVRSCVESFRSYCGPHPIVKLRARCSGAADVFLSAFPDANYVFMFRSRAEWVRSNVRAFGASAQSLVALLLQSGTAVRQMRLAGAPPTVLWYEDLLTDPVAALRAVLPHRADLAACGPALQEVLSRDAQAGSTLSRDALARRDANERVIDEFETLWREARTSDVFTEHGLSRLL